MNQQKEISKRIEKKKEPVKEEAKRTSFAIGGCAFLLATMYSGMITIALGCAFVIILAASLYQKSMEGAVVSVVLLIAFALFGIATYCFGKLSTKSLERSDRMSNNIALNHSDAVEMQTSAILVRASQQPLQAQEAILLRPATTQGLERHAEQLLRPAEEKETALNVDETTF